MPIPVSRNPYEACQANPELPNAVWTKLGVSAIDRPRLNCPTVPWSVFASRTVSCRRNCQPASSSARKPGRGVRRVGRGADQLGDDHRGDQARRGQVGRAVDPEGERDGAAEEGDEQPGQRVADDVGDRLADPQRRVRAEQVLLRDDAREDRHARRAEEDRDARDQEDERVDEDDVRDRRDRQDQDDRGSQDVADDHDLLVVPAVDERARDRAQQQVRQRGREEDQARRERGARRDRHHGHQCELVEPIAEERDELTRPQRRERGVEGEADIGMLANGNGGRCRRAGCDRAVMAGAAIGTGGRGRGRRRADVAQCRRRPSVAFERLERRRRHPRPGAAQHERALQRDGRGQGRRQAGLRSRVARPSRTGRRTRHGQPLADDRQVGFVELLRAANDRGEQEERETEHQEHVADRRDVLDDRAGGSG